MTEEKLPVWQTMKFWLVIMAVIILVALGNTDMAKRLLSSEVAEQVETHEVEKSEATVAPKEEPEEEGRTGATG